MCVCAPVCVRGVFVHVPGVCVFVYQACVCAVCVCVYQVCVCVYLAVLSHRAAPVPSVMCGRAQVHRLGGNSASLARGGGGRLRRLGDLDALGGDRFLLVFELQLPRPAVPGGAVILAITEERGEEPGWSQSQ